MVGPLVDGEEFGEGHVAAPRKLDLPCGGVKGRCDRLLTSFRLPRHSLPHSTKAAASLELINEVLSVGDELAARFCQLILAQMIIVEHDRTF